MPFVGLAAVLPQFAPPLAPGMAIVSINAGGVNRPSLRAFEIRSRHDSRSWDVSTYGLRSSAVSRCDENGGGLVGKGCVGHACSPGMSLFGHRLLVDRPDRLPGRAVEDVEKTRLAGLRDDVDRLAVAPDRRQLRRRAVVEVPEIVVHHLEVPQPPAGSRIERQERRAEQVGADPIGAVVVVGRRAGGK